MNNINMVYKFQKLLWAVSEVLKSCGIDSHHKQYRPFLQQLFKVCSKQWLQQPSSDVKVRTSEAMRALVMKHKSTVLKLKSKSPKNDTINKDYVVPKPKSLADVRKVLSFTDSIPKSTSDSHLEKNDSDLGTERLPIENVSSNIKNDNLMVFIDFKKFHSTNNTEDPPDKFISSASEIYSNLNVDSHESKAVFEC